MPLFSYVIKDKLKKVLKGTTEATSEEALRKHFREQGYLVFSISKLGGTNSSEEKWSFFENLTIGKLIFILILIGGSYFLVKNTSQLSSIFRKKEDPAKVKTIPKDEFVIEPSEIISKTATQDPQQDMITDKTTPLSDLGSKPKENVVTIILKGSGEKTKSEMSSHYIQAKKYYAEAKKLGREHSYRLAIKYAQRALMARKGNEEEIKAFIRDCRRKLREQ